MAVGHSVEPDSGKEEVEVITAFLAGQVDQGVLTPADAEALLPSALLDWRCARRGRRRPTPPLRRSPSRHRSPHRKVFRM
jgi:hypothetical protein